MRASVTALTVMASPGRKIEELLAGEAVAADFDLALDEIDGALLVGRVERSGSAGGEHDLGIEPIGMRGDGRGLAEGAAGDDPRPHAPGLDDRQRRRR